MRVSSGFVALSVLLLVGGCGRCGGPAEEPDEEAAIPAEEEESVVVEPTEDLPTEFAAHYAAQGEEAGGLASGCEDGDAQRCRWLGDLARYGAVSDGLLLRLEGEEEPARAIQLYQRGCFLNDVWSCLEMSRMYSEGVLVPESSEMASSLRHSARAGLDEACVVAGGGSACVGLGVAERVLGNEDEARAAWGLACTSGVLEGCRWLVTTGLAEGEQLSEVSSRLSEGCGTDPEWPWCLAVASEDGVLERWRTACGEGSGAACRLLLEADEEATEEESVVWSQVSCGADACAALSPDRSSLDGWLSE